MKGERSLISFSASTSNEDLINKEVGVISWRWVPDARTTLFVDTEHLSSKNSLLHTCIRLVFTHAIIQTHMIGQI